MQEYKSPKQKDIIIGTETVLNPNQMMCETNQRLYENIIGLPNMVKDYLANKTKGLENVLTGTHLKFSGMLDSGIKTISTFYKSIFPLEDYGIKNVLYMGHGSNNGKKHKAKRKKGWKDKSNKRKDKRK